jgi:Ras and EF-hand domain-containing protein
MRSEISLTPEQLEAVFDSLDVNKNGYLTIEQFLSGFGEYDAGINDSSDNLIVKDKGKVYPITGHEGPDLE